MLHNLSLYHHWEYTYNQKLKLVDMPLPHIFCMLRKEDKGEREREERERERCSAHMLEKYDRPIKSRMLPYAFTLAMSTKAGNHDH